MSELLTNGTSAWPYLIVLVLCVFLLLTSGLQRRTRGEGKRSGPHAAWRVSEIDAPLRPFWHVRRKRRS